MSALIYLLSKKAVNRIKEAFRRPMELILIILMAALTVYTVVTGNHSGTPTGTRSIEEFYAIVLALYVFVFVLGAKSGFVNGASMFSMADVNLLFPSPQKPRRLLTFGLLSQFGHSLTISLILLYQYSWLNDAYGISLLTLFTVLIGYGITVFCANMLAMLIYSFTAGSDKRNKICKVVFYAVIGAFLLYLAAGIFTSDGELIDNAVKSANSPVLKFFPVAGFVHFGVFGAVNGEWVKLAVAVACFAAFCGVYLLLVSILNADYYEDVLKATEVSFSAITARKEGKALETAPRNVKVGKSGFSKGSGATAIYEKHKIENRRSKLFCLDIMSIVFAVITNIMAAITKDALMAMIFNVYLSIFFVGKARWTRELILPYIYMIPEPPFKKLANALREQIPFMLAESVVTFAPFYFVLRCGVGEILGFIAAKVSFSLLFTGVSLIMERFFGDSQRKMLTTLVYFLTSAAVCIPAIAVYAVIITLQIFSVAGLFAMAGVNAVISLILIFCCRNILGTAEYNNK